MALTDTIIDDITDTLVSHAMACPYFDRVNEHEPKDPPGHGLTCAVWLDELAPAPTRSGLSSTTALMTWNARMYSPFVGRAPDEIDRELVKANSDLFIRYAGDLSLGGNVCSIDLRGMTGVSLRSRAGYMTHNQTPYRIFTITIPVIVNDAWDEAP